MLHEGGKAGGARAQRSTLTDPIAGVEAFAVTKSRLIPRVACIGCGYWGKKVARNLASLNALHAVSDVMPDAVAHTAGQYATQGLTFEAILEDPECDAVAIASPASLRAEHERRALLAGKHVFDEKPLALQLFEGHSLEKLARERSRTLMIGHLLRYHPIGVAPVVQARSGRLGTIKLIYSRRFGLGMIRTEEDVTWSCAPHV